MDHIAPPGVAQLRRFQWAVRATLAVGVAASVCANVLHARDNPISQTIAAWPPLALLLTVELVSRVPVHRRGLALARIGGTAVIAGIAAYVSYFHMAAVAARYGESGLAPNLLPLSVDGLIIVASVSLIAADPAASAPEQPPADQPDHHNGHRQPSPPLTLLPAPHLEPASIASAVDADPDLVTLLAAARAARDELHRQGRSLTRDSLARQLRRDGHTIRTSRVSDLLTLLKNDTPAAANGRRPTSDP